jgi:hypothetical protein
MMEASKSSHNLPPTREMNVGARSVCDVTMPVAMHFATSHLRTIREMLISSSNAYYLPGCKQCDPMW